MTTDLLKPDGRIFFMSDGFGIKPKVYKGNGNNKVYSGVAVFRSGTFRDSNGVQNTWEDLHIKQMMDNYNYLQNKNILQSVPVRDGHPGFIINNVPGKGAVVGWHKNLQVKTMKSPVDGQDYSYLLADYEMTEPYALEKITNGTWRNRSAEVGGYTTNGEAEFWPVYMGFAFVDFSAVEGLNFSSSQGKFYAHFGGTTSKEKQVADNQQGTGAPAFPLPVLPSVQSAPQQAQHAAPTNQVPAAPFVFSMGGQNVSDPNAVQSYIRQLETFASETRAAGRRDFVSALVNSNKLGAPQKEGMEKFALMLSDEQYDMWKAQWDAAQPMPLLANHGGGVTNHTGSTGGPSNNDPQVQALADAEQIIQMHERGGAMKPDQIKATASYRLLVAAGKRPA